MRSGMLLTVLVGVFLLAGAAALLAQDGVVMQTRSERPAAKISLDVKDSDVSEVLAYIGEKSGRNIVIKGEISDKVTLRLVDVPWRRALDLVVQQFHGVIEEEGPDILRVSKPEMITFETQDGGAPLPNVINLIAKTARASVVIGPGVNGTVNCQLYDVPWTSALSYVVRANGFIVLQDQNVLQVVDPRSLETQLVTRVFQLRYLQPPDIYRAKIESEFAEKTTTSGSSVAGVSGEGEMLGGPLSTVGGIAGISRGAAARTSSSTESPFKLLEALRKVASTKGRIDYVDTANALIITDTEPNVKAIGELLEAIDIEPLQVFIDVRFITTDITNRFRFGVNWANGISVSNSLGSVVTKLPFSLGDSGFPDDLSVSGKAITPADVVNGLGDLDRGGVFQFGILDFSQTTQAMDFFASDEGSDIQQAPKLLVLDNHVATIFVGDTIRFAETDSASNQAGGVEVGIREADNSPIQTGFQLWVQPHVVPGEDKVILTIIPEAEVLSGKGQTIEGFDDFTNGLATIQLPRVRSSTVVTKLILKDGQTAVLGGLINETTSKIDRKVPILGDVPGLGWAFRWKSDLNVKNNLLIFVTVRIVHNGDDQREIFTSYGQKHGGRTYRQILDDESRMRLRTTPQTGQETPVDTLPMTSTPKPS